MESATRNPRLAGEAENPTQRQFLVTLEAADAALTDGRVAEAPPSSSGPTEPLYDPTAIARSYDEAVAPVGLTAYGGAQYVPARWTRFQTSQEVYAFMAVRNSAFYAWVDSIVAGLQQAGYDPELRWEPAEGTCSDAEQRQPLIKLPALNPGYEFAPNMCMYDEWTWAGTNPVARIAEIVRSAPPTEPAV